MFNYLPERIMYLDTKLVSMKSSGIFFNQYACFSRWLGHENGKSKTSGACHELRGVIQK